MLSWDDYHKQESAPAAAMPQESKTAAPVIEPAVAAAPEPVAAAAPAAEPRQPAAGASTTPPAALVDNIARANESLEHMDVAPGLE
jgi:ribonucleoside-diphosphate reductase beta chain